DLESTMIHNLVEIIKLTSQNSYSSNKSFYFVYNLNREKLHNILELSDIRCLLNLNENVSELAEGSSFIFFNKKNNRFINYSFEKKNLDFETELINKSKNFELLQDNLQKIKTAATRIFFEMNQVINLKPDTDQIKSILESYNPKYWNKILRFTNLYYGIKIPELEIDSYTLNASDKRKENEKDFSGEFELIISQNVIIAKEFVKLLDDFRSKKVNPSNLELNQLYDPQKLYNYLRNHHWKHGIINSFLSEWIKMRNSNHKLNYTDLSDFE
ncbi:unnamed protein product, partial [marine sediment metagenome]